MKSTSSNNRHCETPHGRITNPICTRAKTKSAFTPIIGSIMKRSPLQASASNIGWHGRVRNNFECSSIRVNKGYFLFKDTDYKMRSRSTVKIN